MSFLKTEGFAFNTIAGGCQESGKARGFVYSLR